MSDLLVRQPNGRLLQQGWSPKCIPSPSRSPEIWGVLKTTAIQAGWFDDRQNKELPSELEPREAIEVAVGDLLMTCAGPRSRCGVPALVRRTRPRLMMSGKMYRFRPKPELRSDFLELWLQSDAAQASIDAMKTGISDSGLNLTQDRFLSLRVPVPPIVEQQRIVEMLEDHLSRLEAGRGEMAQAHQRLGAMWQSALHAKIVGPATTLGELSVEAGYGTSTKCAPDGSGLPVARIPNIRRGRVDMTDVKYAVDDSVDLTSLLVRRGDVLIVRTNGSIDLIGRAAVAEEDVDAAFASYLIRFRVDEKKVLPRWVGLALESPSTRRAIERMAASSAGQHNLGLTKLNRLRLPCPPLREQAEALEDLRSLEEAHNQLSNAMELSRRRENTLRRALLSAAFDGRLTGRGPNHNFREELVDV